MVVAVIATTPTPVGAAYRGASDDSGAVAMAVRSVTIVRTAQGTGAGVAVGDARVVTAAHVIEGATTVQLYTADGRDVQATVVRRDRHRDLAVLIAPGLDLPAAPLQSQPPNLGDSVYAAGAPMGDYLQLTAGIVSALPDRGGVAYIQTDAPINPGNSGGPLLDVEGRVIGIVVTKRSTGEGIAWATAASEVETVLAGADLDPAGASDARSDDPSGRRPISDHFAWPEWTLPLTLLGAFLLGTGAVHLRLARSRRTRRVAVEVLDPLDLTDDPEFNPGKAHTWTP